MGSFLTDGARFGTIINVEWHYFVGIQSPEHPGSCGAYDCPCIQYYPGVMASPFPPGHNERVTGLIRISPASHGQTITLTATPRQGEVCPEPDIWEGLANSSTKPALMVLTVWTAALTRLASRPQRTLSSRARFWGDYTKEETIAGWHMRRQRFADALNNNCGEQCSIQSSDQRLEPGVY